MIIHRDCFVAISYYMHLDSGEILRGSEAGPAILTFVAGYREIMPGLENRLLGMRKGEKKEFVVPPEEAFGFYDPTLVQGWDRERFPADADLHPGMAIVPAKSAIPVEFPFRVVEVRPDKVVLDQNHPLAGKKFHYQVEVIELRPATDAELEPLRQCQTCEGEIG